MFGKSVTCKRIGKYLEKHGWEKYDIIEEKDEKEGVVVTGWRSRTSSTLLMIDPMVERNLLSFKAAKVLTARPSSTPTDQLVGLLMAMAHLNWQLIMGKWSYDPSDGEVRFELGIPIDDDDLSFEEFDHCLKAVIAATDGDRDKLKAVADGSMSISQFLKKEGGKSMG